MGTGYRNSISQWSNGDYSSESTNDQDDIAILGNSIGLAADEAGDTFAAAEMMASVSGAGGTTYSATGVISSRNDIDVWRFSLEEASDVVIEALPWRSDIYTAGSNLDIKLKLNHISNGNMFVTAAAPSGQTDATISRQLNAGIYAVSIMNDGDPNSYSRYGSLGQYDVSVTAAATNTTTTTDVITTTTSTSTTTTTTTTPAPSAPFFISEVGESCNRACTGRGYDGASTNTELINSQERLQYVLEQRLNISAASVCQTYYGSNSIVGPSGVLARA